MKVTIKETTSSGQSEETHIVDVDQKNSESDDSKMIPCPGPIVTCPKLLDILATVFGSGWCKNAKRKRD